MQTTEKQIGDTDTEYDDYLCNHLEEVDEACNKEWSNILNQMADNFKKLEDVEFKFRRKKGTWGTGTDPTGYGTREIGQGNTARSFSVQWTTVPAAHPVSLYGRADRGYLH